MTVTSRFNLSFGRVAAIAVLATGFAALSPAQLLPLPDVSQHATVSQRVSLTDITIAYNRPLVGGRKVWGGLVPFGEVWRAGADLNTTIEFSTPVSVEGKPLAKGVYGLHMIPTAETWTIIFSKANQSWGSYTYDQAEDALRVTVKPQPAELQEALKYDFDDLKATSAVVALRWEKLAVPFTVAVNETEATVPLVRSQVRGVSWFTWENLNAAAAFCLDRKINLEEALRWTERSLTMEERFENLQTKASLLTALNRAADAAVAQKRALEIAPAPQLYTHGRQLQGRKQGPEALEVFKTVAKRFPDGVFGHLAAARVASSTGDFTTALKEAKTAQEKAPSPEQKNAVQGLIDRLEKKEDVNK